MQVFLKLKSLFAILFSLLGCFGSVSAHEAEFDKSTIVTVSHHDQPIEPSQEICLDLLVNQGVTISKKMKTTATLVAFSGVSSYREDQLIEFDQLQIFPDILSLKNQLNL